MVAGTSRGLTLEGMQGMAIGQIIDYIITWNNMHNVEGKEETKKESVKKATQGDWDAFFG